VAGSIGIRREDKSEWERRVPLTPEQVRALVESGVDVVVQPSPIRAYPDDAYSAAGATVDEDLSNCAMVLAVKEIPRQLLRQGGAYLFFSHTIKGQQDNMPMLQRLIDLGCTLIDYEKIVDDKGRRLVFFGRHAGLAGMIDTLWAFGQRMTAGGIATPLSEIEPAHRYPDLDAARERIVAIGKRLASEGVPRRLQPLVCGFAGYGNVSQGAQAIYDLLPVEPIAVEDLASVKPASDRVFKVVFHEEHLVRPVDTDARFELQEYYDHPERYQGVFETHLPHLTMLVNCIYWTEAYPRLVSKEWVRRTWAEQQRPTLRVIGDISCDIGGAVEVTLKATDSGSPVFVYEAKTGKLLPGVQGHGPVVLAVDNLPCELPVESSTSFGEALAPFLGALAGIDTGGTLADSKLPDELERAVILWRGELTSGFEYLRDFL